MKEKLITAEAGTSLFQPDLLLPTQFFAALKQKAQACGERRLMVAILEDGSVLPEASVGHRWPQPSAGC